ncbi:MAG: hypothetical protein CFE38_08945 [Comamonadaceae bacterium PBBC1]|nr:MAG: hypothetical protein CFE38_08945 [Comamonadaceae bacterium PBBC1]
MHIGSAKQGHHMGVATLFLEACEVMEAIEIEAWVTQHQLRHIHINDPDNSLDYSTVHALFADDQVTLAVTQITQDNPYTHHLQVLLMAS